MGDILGEQDIAMLTLTVPAKINLTLEVLGRRADGFHEIRSVIQAVTLSDRLNVELSTGTEISCDLSKWNPELSLVSKAVMLMKEAAGYAGGVTIEIEKRIPLMSGLGGDSSDAAATLRTLNQLWECRLPDERLREMAAQLGSDVAFFLYGGTALLTGRGENVTELPPLPRSWFVILVPPLPAEPGKTGRMYGMLNASHYTSGQVTVNLVSSVALGGQVSLSRMANVFDGVALDVYPDLEEYWAHFSEAGARDVHVAGSGPALFTALKDGDEAERVYNRLQRLGLECYLAENFNRGGA